MSVLTDTVDAGIFYPPDAALDEIACYVTVTLIQVRHHLSKPAVGGDFFLILTGMNVHHAGGLK